VTGTTDHDLLRDYAANGSNPAFEQLVRRHVHLVHAAALRQCHGDPHAAEDVTQAVFMVLARRAAALKAEVSLTGWLINTTRYAALSARKLAARRHFHERRATAMAPDHVSPPDLEATPHDALATTLDAALSRLRAGDRSAIALRYLQGKNVTEVAAALGVSTHAAQKRLCRALDRLRDVLVRHGVTTPSDILESRLTALSLHVAPAALVTTVVSGGAVTTTSAVASIAGATTKALLTAKLKLVSSVVAASVLVAGAAAPLVLNAGGPAPAVAAAAPATPAAPKRITGMTLAAPASVAASQPAAALEPPMKLPNASFFQNYNAKDFTGGIDPDTVRVPGGDPATILTSDTPQWGIGGSVLRGVEAAPFHGKRIRFSAYVKCEGLANWGGLWLLLADMRERVYANDDMGGRPLTKTTDWTRMEIVCDVPPECEVLRCGLNLRGKGKIWMDSPQIEVVSEKVPITDDSVWHPWSFSSPHYATRLDESTRRLGHATRLLESKVAGSGEWFAWDWNNRKPDPWLGKRMKFSAWIKTENVTGPSGLCLRVIGPNFQEIVPGLSKDQRNIRGTTDWTRYEFTADIPPETQNICTGVRLGGKGRMWVDGFEYEEAR
jgi:RNA polymerase sigma factor (sigma-70 family)